MMAPAADTAVALFSGGRGGTSIARELLRRPGTGLSLLINGYDNGLSTGMLRHYLPGMLGPSDFRKNLLLHLDSNDRAQASLSAVLEHRLPAGATQRDIDRILTALTAAGIPGDTGKSAGPCCPRTLGGVGAEPRFGDLPRQARGAIAAELSVLRQRLQSDPDGLELADCALGNLIIAGAYLRRGGDFNAAIRVCAEIFASPLQLLNVSNGENAFLVALKRDGRLLADEAEIVAPQSPSPITDLFLLRDPLPPACVTALAGQPAAQVRQEMARRAARVSLNPAADAAIRQADLLVYGPGTPHSSLLPSYLTPGIGDAIATSRARAKVFIVNIQPDHDVQGLTPRDLVDRTLAYLGDPSNRRRTITHVLSHRGRATPARQAWAGAQWITADLVDPRAPDRHDGARTVSALTEIAAEPALVGPR